MLSQSASIVLLGLLLQCTARAADEKPFIPISIRGVDPAVAHRYSNGNFTCLDGSLTIPLSAVNDDYCDCPDGSDEPGTSACEGKGTWFWCKNEGHIPGRVMSGRVNDGLCDPECCDGSDEWATGACPDRCAEIGKEYREQKESDLKTRKTGAKIRSTYIKWATGERKRLEEEIVTKRQQVSVKQREVDEAKSQLQRIEARSKEDLEKRKQALALYTHVLSQRLALTRLRSKTSRLEKELNTLHNILEELSKGYNPNYQDMAVKAAVKGYEEVMAVPEVVDGAEAVEVEEEIEDRELDDLEKKDLDAMLLSDTSDLGGDEEDGLLYRIDEYIPDALYDSWETIRDFAIDWMIRIGFLGKGASGASKGSAEGPQVAAAREKHSTLSNELNRLSSDITNAENTLERMKTGYGHEAEWKKLDETCVSTISGDYTYELCFFGKATQKSNKDSSSNHLGSFTEWNMAAPQGSYDYYTTQNYRNGAKCWNGPMRSATVDMSCGTTNALLSISEPEKCEYFFKVTSPALCWPIDTKKEGGVKDEL